MFLKKIQQTIIILLSILLFTACSVKQGATIGGTAGLVAGGLIGAGLSKQHVGNGKTTQSALQVGLVLGLAGMLIGAGTGYVVDEVSKDDKEIQDIIESNKQIEEMYK